MWSFDTPSKYLYVVRSELRPDADEEAWNRWYSEVDVPEMLALNGIRSATRFRELENPKSYLTAYEIESPEVFDTSEYVDMAGWRGWGPQVTRARRIIYQVAQDLGPVAE